MDPGATNISEYHRGVTHNQKWSVDEEIRLCELYKNHATQWDTIRNELNREFGHSLTVVQVKNKFYTLRIKPEYRRVLEAEGMPRIKRGRRLRRDLEHRKKH